MLAANPDVSVIMPAYNAEKYIVASIQSVLDQTHQNFELIVVNDGSKDNTQAIVEKMRETDARIVLINQVNKKLPAARNTGIREARGTWIAFLDADDIWLPQKLELQLAATKTVKADVFFTGGYTVDEKLNILHEYTTIFGLHKAGDMYNLFYQRNLVPVLAAMVSAEWFKRIGYFDESFVYGCEDWDFWTRMAVNGASFFGMEDKLFYYRRHGDNMSSNNANMLMGQTTLMIKNFVPQHISIEALNALLKNFITTLLNDLVKLNRLKDAYFIIDAHSKISPQKNYGLSKKIIELFGQHSALPLRIVNKLAYR